MNRERAFKIRYHVIKSKIMTLAGTSVRTSGLMESIGN